MSCNHEWSEECYDVVPSQVCVRCNAFEVEEEHTRLIRDSYRRGAEAMREACADVVDAAEDDARPCVRVAELAETIRALPTPEEP